MKLGFTGTRRGMTKAQMETFAATIAAVHPFEEFRHGDCQGADDEAANLVYEAFSCYGPMVIVHPPVDETHRAFNEHYFAILAPLTHFARNRAIVDACDLLIACPCEMTAQPKGGTWMTVGYAKKRKKPVKIIWPDGVIEQQ